MGRKRCGKRKNCSLRAISPFPPEFSKELYNGHVKTQACSVITAASAPIHAFLEFFLPVLRTMFLASRWLLSHITIVETTESGERGMNPVTMTIINPRKEYWPSRGLNKRPPLFSRTL